MPGHKKRRPGKPINNSGDKDRKNNYEVHVERLFGGRPTSLTDEVQRVIIRAIENCSFIETAIALASVPKSTFYDWLKRARDDDKAGQKSIYTDFADAVKTALAVSEAKYIGIVGEAANDTWQAAAWMLERRFRNRWARESEKSKSSDMPNSTQSTGDQTTRS